MYGHNYNLDNLMLLQSYQAIEYFKMKPRPPVIIVKGDGCNVVARDIQDIFHAMSQQDLFGIEPEEWQKLDLNPFHRESISYELYQVKGGAEYRDMRDRSLKELKSAQIKLDLNNYESAYRGILYGMDLNDLWIQFNQYPPKDYVGKAMSMGDIVVLFDGDNIESYFVDASSFVNVSNDLEGTKDQFRKYGVIQERIANILASDENKHSGGQER